MRVILRDSGLEDWFLRVIMSKRVQADELGAIQQGHDRHQREQFQLAGTYKGALVTLRDDGRHSVLFGDPTAPAYELRLNEDGLLQVDFAGEEDQLPDVRGQINRLPGMAVTPGVRVPYGWVSGGRVTTLLSFDGIRRDEQREPVVAYGALDCYVLDGEHLPPALRMGKSQFAWLQQVWNLIQQERLVRLSERLRSPVVRGQIRREATGGPWLEFWKSDGAAPVLVTGQRYAHWFPSEDRPSPTGTPGPLFSKATLSGFFC